MKLSPERLSLTQSSLPDRWQGAHFLSPGPESCSIKEGAMVLACLHRHFGIKAKNRFQCKMQISSFSGYGNRIKLKNNASLDFNEAHLCFFCRSNFWLSSAHTVWTWKFHSSTVCKAVHWSCRKKRWVTERTAVPPILHPLHNPCSH